MSELVVVELHGNCGELVLNRPERRNSLVGPLVKQLHAGLDSLVNNPDCHVIIIRGAKGYFCAGLDLKEFSAEPAPVWRETFSDDWMRFHCAIYDCDKPIIGAVEKFAIAGGSALAFACDFIVVGKDSFVHVAEAEIGMPAPVNIAWLQFRFGYQQALHLTLLAERIYGDELVKKGMAMESVEEDQVVDRARSVGARLAGFDLTSNKRLKRAIKVAHGSVDFMQHIESVRSA